MGRRIVKVPCGFEHPKDEHGEYIPGAHLQPLYYSPENVRTHFQVYEDISDGTPVSPIFENEQALREWLCNGGFSSEAANRFIESGDAPSFIQDEHGNLFEGIEGMANVRDEKGQ